MNVGKLFGATFFSVILALIIYDMLIKGAVSGLFGNKYDNTFNPHGKRNVNDPLLKKFSMMRNGNTIDSQQKHLEDLIAGRERSYRVAA